VGGDPAAQAFHSPEWIDFVCAVGGFENATRLYETPDGRTLVVPMVRRALLGAAVSTQGSLPEGWGIGGVLSQDPVRAEDLSVVYDDLRRQRGVLRTAIQPSSRTAALWASADLPGVKSVPRLSHVLDLDGGFETVWERRFTGSARTAVRKAERAGVVVERDTTGALVPEFYALLEESVDRWARQQHEPLLLSRWRARRRDPMSKLQAMARFLPSVFTLYLARHQGRAVAGIIVLSGTGARYTNGAMAKELAGPVRANYLLHRTAIEDAVRAGSTHYDFGESGGSQALAQFKTRFGARPEPYRSFRIERLPLTELDRSARTAVKRVIGFREPGAPEEGGAAAGSGDDRGAAAREDRPS
jgi:hypothetical protein